MKIRIWSEIKRHELRALTAPIDRCFEVTPVQNDVPVGGVECYRFVGTLTGAKKAARRWFPGEPEVCIIKLYLDKDGDFQPGPVVAQAKLGQRWFTSNMRGWNAKSNK